LENDAEYQRWKIERRNLTRVERDRRAQIGLQAELENARSDSLAKLGPQGTPTPKLATSASRPAVSAPVEWAARPGSGVDISLPGASGGGAIDPVSAAIGIGLAGAAAARHLRRKRPNENAAQR
jgi:hypothetical protein